MLGPMILITSIIAVSCTQEQHVLYQVFDYIDLRSQLADTHWILAAILFALNSPEHDQSHSLCYNAPCQAVVRLLLIRVSNAP